MRRSPSRLLIIGFMTLFLVILIGGVMTANAQEYPDDYIHDDRLYVYVALDGMNLKNYSLGSPLPLNLEVPMDLYLNLSVSGSQTLNVSGTITFWYQGYPLFPIQIVDAYYNTWFAVDPFTPIPPVTSSMDFSTMMSVLGPIKLATGVYEATVDFRYYIEGDSTQHILQHQFSFLLPSTPIDIITSVTGITASIATIGAVYGVAGSLNGLWEGLKTAYKLRGIHKKASEIRSLPNLTVLGALPLLFSLLDSMKKEKKEGRVDTGVSEYIVRQRLREVAPDAWQADRCPQCKRKWNTKLDMCKKCNLSHDDAKIAYADLLSEKVPIALRWMGKKKSTDVKTLAKKTKSTQYNAGVIAASMVDTNVTEITKVGTPLRSFVMNTAGLAFLVITWQQLLGDSSSAWLTTLTIVGAALSLAVIVALYFTRKVQIAKFVAEQDAGLKILPTQEEFAAAAKAEPETAEEATKPETTEEPSSVEETYETEEYVGEEEVSEEDADEDAYSDEYDDADEFMHEE